MVKQTSSLKKNSSKNDLVVAKELTFGYVKAIEFPIILGDTLVYRMAARYPFAKKAKPQNA